MESVPAGRVNLPPHFCGDLMSSAVVPKIGAPTWLAAQGHDVNSRIQHVRTNLSFQHLNQHPAMLCKVVCISVLLASMFNAQV